MADLQGKPLKQVIDPTLAKAFTHPLRGHIWVTLFERGEVSPTEIAKELDLEASEVSYHFRKLQKKKLIRLVRTVQRRGFDEHFYEPAAPAFRFDDATWMKLPEGVRSAFSGEMVRHIIDEFTGALEAGCFDARNRHLSRTWLMVDERGWKELMRTMKRTLDRVIVIQERCAKRQAQSPQDGIPVSVALAAFETVASTELSSGSTEAL